MKNTIKLMYYMLRARIKKEPYKLNFMVTSFCNSRCTTCNVWRNPTRINEELTFDEIEKIFKKLPDTICWLSLTGGEPFSRKDFGAIIKSAIKNISPLTLIGIPTNGLYQKRILAVTKEIMTLAHHPDIIISLSIDGPEEIHEQIRQIPGGFKKTWETYERLRELTKNDKDITIAIETTISNKNIEVIFPFLQNLLAQKHLVSLTFAHEAYLYQNTEGNLARGIIPANIEQIKKIVSLFHHYHKFWNPKDFIENQYIKRVPLYLQHPKQKPVPCTSLSTTISIDAFGIVIPCLMWGKELGKIQENDYELQKIYDSPIAQETRDHIKEDKCPICWTPCEAYQSMLWDILKWKD